MTERSLKAATLSGLLWKFLERGGAQSAQFIIQVMLARLLMPKEYGLVALVMVFITISNVFINSGFKMSLIQKKNADEIDFSSVFFISLFIALLFYILLFFISPYLAIFFEEPKITSLIRVLAVVLFFGSINSVQNAFIARHLLFRYLFYSSLIGIIISGFIGVSMAYRGYGAWSLVAQQLIFQFFVSVILWFILKWRPVLQLSLDRLKGLFSYGWKILAANIINSIYNNLRSVFVGKLFNASMLGLYNRGMQFPALIVTNINDSILAVMFPVFSSQQDDRLKVKNILRRSIAISSFLVFPMMFGLATMARPIILILLTEKWLAAVPFMQIYCFTYLFWPLQTANGSTINALGYSGITLKLEIVKKSIGLTILSISVFFGIYAIALGALFSSFIYTIIDIFPNRTLLNYSYKELWIDVRPSLLLSIFMSIGIYSINFLNISIFFTLILQIITGVFMYLSMALLFDINCFRYLIFSIKQLLELNKGKSSAKEINL